MSIPGGSNPLLLTSAAGGGGGYEISRSLRFNSSDSAYLSRTPASAGNRRTYTYSTWVKRAALGTGTYYLFAAVDGGNADIIGFVADRFHWYNSFSGPVNSQNLHRDPSAWYHVLASVDSTQAISTDRVKLYVNGAEVAYAGNLYPSLNRDFAVNNTVAHKVGQYFAINSSNFYLADVHFIDGQALDPTSFGEFDTNGVWQPKAYEGTYGTNGFYLPFSDNSTAAALGTDTSGNGNTWTVNNIAPGPVSSTVVGMAWSSTLDTLPDWSSFPSLTTIDTYSLTNPASFTINSFSGVGSNPYFGYWWSSDGVSWTRSSSNGVSPPYTTATVNRYLRLSLAGSSIVTSATAGTETFTSAFVDADSLVDSPTNYGTDTGVGGEVRGNYATLNPLFNGQGILSDGNLQMTNTGSAWGSRLSTIAVSSGKWYFECVGTANMSNGVIVGILKTSGSTSGNIGSDANGYSYYNLNGQKFNGGPAGTAYGSTWTTNDVIGCAFDVDNGTLTFYKNNVSQGVAFSSLSATSWLLGISCYDTATANVNFGQRPFAYTAPSGFKALCTTNLPEPTIADGSTAMDVALYTGNGSTQTISGLNFSPDLIWIKERNNSRDHVVQDIIRGSGVFLSTNLTNADQTSGGTGASSVAVQFFNSDGFTIGAGTGVNGSSNTYVAWTWDAGSSTVTNTQGSITSQVRANASAGFSVVGFTMPSSGTNTIGHSLGDIPSLVILKSRANASGWVVYHASTGAGGYTLLNSTNAYASDSNAFNNTAPTSSVFTVSTSFNGLSGAYVAYCFAPVAGYSSFGSYTGNGSTDGPFVYTGFRPRWILIKRSDATNDWLLTDSSRLGYNIRNELIWVNLSAAEYQIEHLDILSNGFKIRTTNSGWNGSGGTYIYAAFAENPFQYARAR